MSVDIRVVPWDDPAGAALREAQRVEVRKVFYPHLAESEPGPHPTADDIAVFLVAFDGDRAVGTGALRAIDGDSGEIKRMYVDPGHRGTGVATAIVRALEDHARALGWDRLLLETGDVMLQAQRFYTREGFTPIPAFGPYVDSDLSMCFGKDLS